MKKLLLLILPYFIFQSGCIQTPEPDVTKRAALIYNVGNVGEQITAGQDTMVVDVVKVLAERINLVMTNDVVLQTQPEAIIMTYRRQFNGEDETVFQVNITFEDLDSFKATNFFISPPAPDASITDTDFFGSDTTFSFIMEGSFNDQSFTFNSSPLFNKEFPFDSNILLTNEKETLVLRLHYDMQDIVTDPSGSGLLDPDVSSNKATIDSLLQANIKLEAFSADLR